MWVLGKIVNKLKSNIFGKKSWGSEVTWALTNNYMAKTVSISKDNCTPLIVHEDKEKSIIVIKGYLYLTYGPYGSDNYVTTYKIPEGWSWYIEPGNVYRYRSIEEEVLIIEISTPQLEDSIVLVNESEVNIDTSLVEVELFNKQLNKEKEKK